MSELINMLSDEPLAHQRVVVAGESGNGKTFMSGTMSEYWDPTFKSATVLKDMLWWYADDGGLDGFTSLGIDVPKIDFLRNVQTEKDLLIQPGSFMRKAIDATAEGAAKGWLKTLVIDLSSIDRWMFSFQQPKFGKDYGLYDFMIAYHNRLYLQELRKLPCHIIMNVHAKDKPQSFKDRVELARFEQLISITGQASDTYRNHSSLILAMRKMKTGPDKFEFSAHPYGIDGGLEGKCRYPMLTAKEPANLKTIYDKIRQARALRMQSKVAV